MQGPLRVYLICPDELLRAECERALAGLEGEAILSQAAWEYPCGTELARTLRTFSPQVVLLSFERPETAVAVIRFLESEAEGLPVIGLSMVANTALMREGMRAGARDFLCAPVSGPALSAALAGIRRLLARAPLSYLATEHIYSLLPAKPGVGATTVAINLSAALAQLPGKRVLLTDLDLTCGMVRFLLRLPHELSIVDALARAEEMDASLWPQLVARREGFDVLHSGGIHPQAYLEPHQMQSIIDFARCNYNALFFDLSGNLERHSLQVMRESKRIFLVCNPEPCSLYLGREKLRFLRSLGVGEQVSAVLNRAGQALAVPAGKVAAFLEIPIAAELADDTVDVSRAIQQASSVLAPGVKAGRLAVQFREWARALVTPTVSSGHSLAPVRGMLTAAPR
jgi:pilus assembly protein CpaE